MIHCVHPPAAGTDRRCRRSRCVLPGASPCSENNRTYNVRHTRFCFFSFVPAPSCSDRSRKCRVVASGASARVRRKPVRPFCLWNQQKNMTGLRFSRRVIRLDRRRGLFIVSNRFSAPEKTARCRGTLCRDETDLPHVVPLPLPAHSFCLKRW